MVASVGEVVEALRARGIPAVSGDATDTAVLIQAHIAHAAMLVVATPDPMHLRQIVDVARTLNPAVKIILRTHSEDEAHCSSKTAWVPCFSAKRNWPRA